jgi:uncharacterized protein YlxW (UPF0749 family)
MRGRTTPEFVTLMRELRRRAFTPPASRAPEPPSLQRQVSELRAQVAHLEQLVQGLQDAVYRDSRRHDERITEIQERIAPAAIASALSQDARNRGL